jgi:hypothetical protein
MLEKRKHADEMSVFPSRLPEYVFCICIKWSAISYVCNESISAAKEYCIKRHSNTKYASNWVALRAS